MKERLSRREAMVRLARAGAVLGAAAGATRLAFDRGGFDLSTPEGERQIRDFATLNDSMRFSCL
jgi:hypothetical protein